MQLAKVLGQVVSTVKESGLGNLTLLVVQDADEADPDEPGGAAYVAVDLVGAGEGELVLVVHGSAARIPAATAGAPADCAVVAIADSVIRQGTVVYRKA